MARYRRSRIMGATQAVVDPGKDLFAYLFILIMVFSFMLLMTTEERHSGAHNQRAPESIKASRSQLAEVNSNCLGRLAKDGDDVVMIFADKRYMPMRDLKKLIDDGRIIISRDRDGQSRQTLFLSAAEADKVSLVEYLAAFSFLSEHDINVAFADRVN